MGLGLLLGLAVLSYGFEHGCTTAEILAINDEGTVSTTALGSSPGSVCLAAHA